MIYSSTDMDLIDCEYVDSNPKFTHDFLRKFYTELEAADRLRNSSSSSATSSHHMVNNEQTDDIMEDIDADVFGMRNLTYTSLRTDNDVPSELQSLMDYDSLKAQCDAKHKQMMRTIDDLKDHRRASEREYGDAQPQLSRYINYIYSYFPKQIDTKSITSMHKLICRPKM